MTPWTVRSAAHHAAQHGERKYLRLRAESADLQWAGALAGAVGEASSSMGTKLGD